MTIPEPTRTSHFISNDHLDGNRLRATITTHAATACGQQCTSEVVDHGAVPSFSVRVMGVMIPNAAITAPNIRVVRFITADWVDFPSHQGADGDIRAAIMESANVVFLKDLAKYACEQDEKLSVVCESFQISPDEVQGIADGSIVVSQSNGSNMRIMLDGDIRREVIANLTQRGLK